jgi:hypothetical protein
MGQLGVALTRSDMAKTEVGKEVEEGKTWVVQVQCPRKGALNTKPYERSKPRSTDLPHFTTSSAAKRLRSFNSLLYCSHLRPN